MLGLMTLEVYNSIFNITHENNKFELHTDTFDEFSLEELKDELEEIVNISNNSHEHLQDEIIGPRIFSAYKKIETGKRRTDGYYMFLMGYARSPFRDFESYLRIVVGLDEDDIQLILKQYNSNFVTYEKLPGIYSVKDISQVVYTMGDHEGTIKIEYSDITMKTKPILKRFGGAFGTLRLDDKSLFTTLLGVTPYWDYKPTKAIHADSPGVYTSDKNLNLCKIDKIHLKSDVINGFVVNGTREPTLFSYVLDKPRAFRMFCEYETIHYKKKQVCFEKYNILLR